MAPIETKTSSQDLKNQPILQSVDPVSAEKEYQALIKKNGDQAMKLIQKIKKELSKIPTSNHLPETDKKRIQTFLEAKQKEYQNLLIGYVQLQNEEQSVTTLKLSSLRSEMQLLSDGEVSVETIAAPLDPVIPSQKLQKTKKGPLPPETRRNMDLDERVDFSKENLRYWTENNPAIEFSDIQERITSILTSKTPNIKLFAEIQELQKIVETFEDGAFGRNSRLALEGYLLRRRTREIGRHQPSIPVGNHSVSRPSKPQQAESSTTSNSSNPSRAPETSGTTTSVSTTGNTNPETATQSETTPASSIEETIPATEVISPEELEKRLETLSNKINEKLRFWNHAITDSSGVIYASEEVNKKNRIIHAKESLFEVIDEYKELKQLAENNKISAGNYSENEILKIQRQVAEYLRGVGEVSNPHFQDLIDAENILKGIIDSENTGVFPDFPSRAQILSKLSKNTKKLLADAVEKKQKEGLSFDLALGQLLSNPTFSSEWGDVRDKALKQYNKEMQLALKELIKTGVKGEKLKALNNLIHMYGAEGWWNLTDAQKNQLFAFGSQAAAIAAGVAGAVLVSTGIGAAGGAPLLALSAAVLTGGAISTGTKIGMEQKIPEGSEIATDFAINTGTFAVGGALAGMTQKILANSAKEGKIGIGTFATAGAVESAGNVSLGMFLDGIQAVRTGSSIDTVDSLKTNLSFALLPIFTHGAFSLGRRALAQDTYSKLQKVKELEKTGQAKAQEEAKKVLQEVAKHVRQEQKILSELELKAIRAVDGYLPEGAVISSRAGFAVPEAPAKRKPRLIIKTAAEIKEEARIAKANDMLRFMDALNKPDVAATSRASTSPTTTKPGLAKKSGFELPKNSNFFEVKTGNSSRPEVSTRANTSSRPEAITKTNDQGEKVVKPNPFKVPAEESSKLSPSQQAQRLRPGAVPPLRTPSGIVIDV